MLYELEKTTYPKIIPLFESTGYSQLFVDAVLEGHHVGRVFVDDPQCPAAALVAPLCEFFFLAGQADNAAFNQAMRERILAEFVSPDGDLLLFPTSAVWQSALEALFGDFKLLRVARKAFTFDPERFAAKHATWREQIPAGYTIRRYDRKLAEETELTDFWGSLDNFLAHGVGFALMKGDEIVSRCHSVMVGGGEAEINIETAEPYRRQGFATLAACAFVEHCLAHHLRPAWSCWDNNIPSQILAHKLGFNRPVDVPAIYAKVK
ncbi:MAG TPA: GNAT family N-acetyltransferase [Anaerolineae bacterium]|nr:GNAT family N-acetyltransferase [Anaerolineae bacterium]HQI87125.1 GNAT family N-acetyltransferase [Anaerolineae bacterium]